MPRSRIAIWAVLLAWPVIGSAQQISEITDYLKPIVAKIAGDPNAGGWTWEANGNGGYLLRMAMDVTGDGVPEQFVTSSLSAVKQVAEWTVFDVSQVGEMRPYLRSIRLPADSVWPSPNEGAPSLVYVAAPDRERELASDEKPYPVYRFSFAFPEIKETLAYASTEEATKLRPVDPNQLPKVQAILLADYLTKPDAKWSEVSEWKLDANDCFFRPDDKERATKNVTFTPQAALSLLGQMQPALHSGNAQATTPKPPRPAPVEKQTPKLAASPTPTAETKPAPSAFPIVPVALVGAVILGIAFFVLRRRSK